MRLFTAYPSNIGFILCAGLMCAVLLPSPSTAGQLFPEALDKSLSESSAVVTATVEKAYSPKKTDGHIVFEYDVRIESVSVGPLQAGEQLTTAHFATDYSRMAKNGMLPFSPIIQGSGLERSLKEKEEYVLLLQQPWSQEESLRIRRAEPLSKKTEIEAALTALGKQSASLRAAVEKAVAACLPEFGTARTVTEQVWGATQLTADETPPDFEPPWQRTCCDADRSMWMYGNYYITQARRCRIEAHYRDDRIISSALCCGQVCYRGDAPPDLLPVPFDWQNGIEADLKELAAICRKKSAPDSRQNTSN